MALDSHMLLAPHFPALLLEARAGREGPSVRALRQAGARWRDAGVQVVVALSAAWDEVGPFQVDNGARHKTLLDMEGVKLELRYACDGWVELANALQENGIDNGLPLEAVHRGMDHGVSVPMSLLFPEADRRVVPLSTSRRQPADWHLWGEVVRETCRGAGARVALLIGGSISYDPEAHAQGRDRAQGADLDRAVLGRLEAGDWTGLHGLPADLLAAARPQCGLRHLWFIEGVLGGKGAGRILAHERLPSIGSAVVEFTLPD